MMITIHGLPPNSKYQDVKVLIKQECKISDFILDNLVAEPNGCKKVRVGLTDDDEGYRLMKCLDRYRCSGNFVLSVLPVGKPTPQNAPMQNTYDSREGFQSQPRNDYPPSGNYGNQGPTVPHDMPSRPQQWVGNNQNSQWNSPSMNAQVPQNSFGYQQNSTPVHQNQPFHQQQASQPVRPEMRAGPQGRGPQEQNFGFQPKSNVPDLRAGRQEGRTHALRSVELLDTPSNPSVQVQGRYPPNNQQYQPQDKPMTIMKDNFQGPSSYIAANNQQQGHFQGHGHGSGQGHGSSQGHSQIQPWTQSQGQQMKQPFPKPTMQYEKYPEERKYPPNDNRSDMKSNEAGRIPQDVYKKYDKSGPTFSSQRMEILRRHSPSGRPVLPSDGRVSPSGRGISAPGRRVSPPGRVVSASGRRISPSGRGISPTGRSISASGRGTPPPGRRISPSGRHIPPSVRHISPSGRHNAPPVRHVSPSGRHIPPSVRHVSPSGRRISPSGRRMSPSGRRISPPGRRISPSGRRISPSGRRISPSGRGISPSGRRISPSGRRISPSGRRISPSGRRISPSGRRISPSGRRISPSGRGISPSGRRISPSGRRISPSDRRMAGRISADRRLVSPTRRDPQRPNMPIRYSPSRHQDKATDKYGNDGQKLKHVRPAYEPTAQAPNQTMYSGGYRPNIHENVQYPIPGARQAELSPWQQERDKAMYSSTMKKLEEERREGGRAQGRGAEQAGAGSPRRSRSPARFKRHSPSPRSPRRSWALEKRRSPDAPPPPVWPGQPRDDDYPPQRHARPEFAPRIDKDDKKHVIPPWERPDFDKDDDHARRPAPDEMRPYGDDRSGPRRSIPDREPAHADRFPPHRAKVPEYTREDFERDHPHRADYRRPDDADRKPYVDKREFRDPPRPADREDRQRPDPAPPRRDSPPRDPSRKGDFRKEIDRDFEDIYKKAQEFKKKTEELRKPGSRRREGYPGEEPEREREPEGEPSAARYHDERHEFRGELARHARRPNDSPDRPRPDDHHAPPSKRKRFLMPPLVKVTRDKAVEELSKKIMDKHLDSNLSPEQKLRIKEELRLALSRILFEMFGEADVSYIEIVIKYQAKYDDRQEHNILRDVMSSMPSQYRNSLKRLAAESCNAIPPKSSRWSPPADWKKDGSRPTVYAAKPKLRKEYEDLKKDVTSLRPKPQRLKQRVIPEANPEDRVRSTRDSNRLRPRMTYEAKMKPRIRREQRLETDKKIVPDTRSEKAVRSETIDDHKIKADAEFEYKTKPEAKSDHKMKQELKPEIKEKSDSIKAEQKVRLESKMKPEIRKSNQRVKEIKPDPKAKSEIISEQKVKQEVSKLDHKLKVEKKSVEALESINDDANSIEDIIEEQLPVPNPSEGHYELNPLMTRMVEAELQNIMIKVWQELPDNSQDDGEKLVADKLRNVAGDDIRNVLGLNVTKRILNVYNPLFVKIQFSGKPDRGNLAKFLRKYNFIAFKRIGRADLFAAQMRTIKDFDRICIAKDIMCGDVKLTVNPCYRFSKCPANLKSTFDDKSEDDEKEETVESEEVHKRKEIDNTASKLELNPAKSLTATDPNDVKTKPSDTDATKTKAEPNTKKSEENITKTTTESDTNVSKPSPDKSVTNIVKTESDKTAPKANKTKKAPITKSITTNSEKNITKVTSTIDTQSKSNKVENKETKKHSKKAEESDNDELDDQDIYALISGGIVLDECSGSDEE